MCLRVLGERGERSRGLIPAGRPRAAGRKGTRLGGRTTPHAGEVVLKVCGPVRVRGRQASDVVRAQALRYRVEAPRRAVPQSSDLPTLARQRRGSRWVWEMEAHAPLAGNPRGLDEVHFGAVRCPFFLRGSGPSRFAGCDYRAVCHPGCSGGERTERGASRLAARSGRQEAPRR